MTHPIIERKLLYCNPGYAVQIDGMAAHESAEFLEELFAHQIQEKYCHRHDWKSGDVLAIDNIRTLHRAVTDYRPNERRLLRRCQVIADHVFTTPP